MQSRQASLGSGPAPWPTPPALLARQQELKDAEHTDKDAFNTQARSTLQVARERGGHRRRRPNARKHANAHLDVLSSHHPLPGGAGTDSGPPICGGFPFCVGH